MNSIDILLYALGILGAIFIYAWGMNIKNAKNSELRETAGFPNIINLITGFVTDFLDTWGIGSFATTTALFRFFKQCPDRLIPGTLNIGHGLPTVAQAFLFISAVEVDPKTLISMIASAVAGAWLGAGVVAGWPKRNIQIGMGLALGVAAGLLLHKQMTGGFQFTDTNIGLEGNKFWIGVGANFILGALMTLGIGLYAPCMILVSFLGMNEKAAFPIMMGSCAFLMPIASYRFMQKSCYAVKPALGLTLAGVPAVFVATYLFKATAMETIRWVVLGVVVYTSATMLYSAYFSKNEKNTP